MNDAHQDLDGDGLLNIQEYYGVDGIARMIQDGSQASGVGLLTGSTDDINPIVLDADADGLVDSFEVAWYDPGNGIDPLAAGNNAADPDSDGLSNYREQCLFEQSPPGRDQRRMDDRPFVAARHRLLRAPGLHAQAGPRRHGQSDFFPANVYLLRNHEWTTPSNDSGYPGEIVRNGWDSDYDYLPDGWEVEFNLNPRSGALFIFNGTNDVVNPNGEWGDPDADGLVNTEKYLGQDGNRGTNNPLVNGSGDETNPNGHNWRPDSTGSGTGI